MKNSISILAAALAMTIALSGCGHLVTTVTPPAATSDTTAHAMLYADSNTIYLDTSGNKIQSQTFMEKVKSGKFIFVPEMKNGKVASVKLKISEQNASMGSQAPEFSGIDMNGHQIDLKALRGKTVILNFWFISCAPCRAEMPELNELAAKYKDDSSVVFVAVTYDSPEHVKDFLKRKDFKFNILAGRPDIIKQYGITGYPTSLVLDKSGHIAFSLTTYDGTNVSQLDGVIGALKKI